MMRGKKAVIYYPSTQNKLNPTHQNSRANQQSNHVNLQVGLLHAPSTMQTITVNNMQQSEQRMSLHQQ